MGAITEPQKIEQPAFRPGVGRLFSVSISAIVEVVFDEEPTEQELRTALLENALDYIHVIRDSETTDSIVDGDTSVELTAEYVDEGSDFGF